MFLSLRHIPSCLLEILPNSAITMLILYLFNHSLMIAGNALDSMRSILSVSPCIPYHLSYLFGLSDYVMLSRSKSACLSRECTLKKRPSHMKAGGSRTSCVLMEGSFYPYRCVCVRPSFGSARQHDGLKAVRTQRQIEYRIATCSTLASHV